MAEEGDEGVSAEEGMDCRRYIFSAKPHTKRLPCRLGRGAYLILLFS